MRSLTLHILLKNLYDHHNGKSPYQGKLKTDIAVKIQRLIGIIPPSCMKAYIQKPSGNQLYRSCKNDSKQKDHSLTHLMSAALKRIKQRKHRKYTKSVHRAYRTVEKSPVYNLS